MAEGTKLEIVSPERLVYSEQAQSVTVPGADGYFSVLGDHAPLMTTLKPGFVTVVASTGARQVFYVQGGFADVSPEGLTILAELARDAAEFDAAEIEAMLAQVEKDVAAAATPEAKSFAEETAYGLRNLLVEARHLNQTTVH
jgi:F-type H+-transporting ATPase subunit epsilon